MASPTTPVHEPDVSPSNKFFRNEFLKNSLSSTSIPEALRERVLCGPLLRYVETDYRPTLEPVWRGSALVVLKLSDGASTPKVFGGKASADGEKIFEERGREFWRFPLVALLGGEGRKVTYEIEIDGERIARSFWVPGREDAMRIMFHSCNGFSVGSDEEDFSGPALWNDVLRLHSEKPFHVMIGGGDQIYCDGIRVNGPLQEWTGMKNPVRRRQHPWTDKLRDECDEWYCENYIMWYSTPPFSYANSQIPQINIWDDHDIIDGFGSYTDRFNSCPVFTGIGKVAFKYYLLFQHHTPPGGENEEDSSWILGPTPGKYIAERSRSVYARLGKRIAFLGVDARSERTRRQINHEDTYDKIIRRAEEEIDGSNGDVRHLVVLLGVPIAYPRLVWLETILHSPVFGFLKFLNKRFGVAGSLFNKFDGQVDILDDLDDHYCARVHKRERNNLLLRLQALAESRSVRVTFLSGDVHLAAVGRFYSKPSLNIPVESDHRYMVNVISSAITNKPPPTAVSNLLAKRNKVHHFNDTDEQLLDFFDKDVDDEPRTNNRNTMPRRNFAILSEGRVVKPDSNGKAKNAIGELEAGAGSEHPAVNSGGNAVPTSEVVLNVAVRVEIDRHKMSGETKPYGFAIPALQK